MNFPFMNFHPSSSARRIDHVNQREKLYSEIIAVCSQTHTEHINTLCGQNVELLNVKLAVRKITAGLQSVSMSHCCCLTEQKTKNC
jgi:hypothetical protein